ncbi:hypothetical protein [Adhaeretor mobilis]|uniref:hypothetical protein n=1 Tax=Adhaeretor mobilis TaxID=1930276 RepID=UPI0011A40148|nr:hypothetical protein [Adhaeretor mobilis]
MQELSVSNPDNELDILPGRYQVAVSASEMIGEEAKEMRWLAPSHYADYRTSGIEVEIVSAKSDLQIELSQVVREFPEQSEGAVETEPIATGINEAPNKQKNQKELQEK